MPFEESRPLLNTWLPSPAATGSDLILAEVAPVPHARAAFDRLAAALPSELREGFTTRGRLAKVMSARN